VLRFAGTSACTLVPTRCANNCNCS